MNRKRLRQIQILILIVLALSFLAIRHIAVNKGSIDTVVSEDSLYYVQRVVDGDTLKLNNGQRVRLIGIDTPEVYYSDKLLRQSKNTGQDIDVIQALGRKASAYTKKMCAGKRVRLEYDVEKRDRYGRLLAYVFLDDGTFLNAKIIEEGYGKVLTIPPNVKYADQLIRLQQEAREANRGLWKR